MNTTELSAFKSCLLHVLTDYDRKQSTKKHHNRYALGIYFQRVDDICTDIGKGADPRAAIVASFCDRLLAHVLRGMKLEPATDAERSGIGNAWHYVPASESAKS